MKVISLGNKIVATLLPPPEKSESGRIWLLTGKDTHSVKYAPKRFRVLEPEKGIQDPETGEWHRTTSLEKGDVIVTGMYPGDSVPDFKIDGEPIWFIHVDNAHLQEIA